MVNVHAFLSRRGAAWVRRQGCDIVLTDLHSSASQRPDVMGFRTNKYGSILIEAKTTRKNFIQDRAKWCNSHRSHSVGMFRFYICRPHIISPLDLPLGWGLIYVEGASKAKLIFGNLEESSKNYAYNNQWNTNAELLMLLAHIRKLRANGKPLRAGQWGA